MGQSVPLKSILVNQILHLFGTGGGPAGLPGMVGGGPGGGLAGGTGGGAAPFLGANLDSFLGVLGLEEDGVLPPHRGVLLPLSCEPCRGGRAGGGPLGWRGRSLGVK